MVGWEDRNNDNVKKLWSVERLDARSTLFFGHKPLGKSGKGRQFRDAISTELWLIYTLSDYHKSNKGE